MMRRETLRGALHVAAGVFLVAFAAAFVAMILLAAMIIGDGAAPR